jgi:arylsulfatase
MVRGDGHDPQAPTGSAATYLCLGPGFSSAANTPFRRHKTWVHEGGISTPFIVHWPAGIAGKNELRSAMAHVIDIAPTVLDLAGIEQVTEPEGPPLPGKSLKDSFSDPLAVLHDELWFYHEGNRALRQGDWKIVHAGGTRPFPWASSDAAAAEETIRGDWALYDLANDRAEQQDLSAQYPARVREMSTRWWQLRDQFLRDAGQPNSRD